MNDNIEGRAERVLPHVAANGIPTECECVPPREPLFLDGDPSDAAAEAEARAVLEEVWDEVGAILATYGELRDGEGSDDTIRRAELSGTGIRYVSRCPDFPHGCGWIEVGFEFADGSQDSRSGWLSPDGTRFAVIAYDAEHEPKPWTCHAFEINPAQQGEAP